MVDQSFEKPVPCRAGKVEPAKCGEVTHGGQLLPEQGRFTRLDHGASRPHYIAAAVSIPPESRRHAKWRGLPANEPSNVADL